MRDNPDDDGIEPSSGTPYESPDIWIYSWSTDANGHPVSSGMPGYSPYPFYNPNLDKHSDVTEDPHFADEIDHNPQYIPTGYGMPVWIYVKIRNKKGNGASTGNEVLKLYWSKASTKLRWQDSWTGKPDVDDENVRDGYFTAPGGDCGNKTLYLGDEITKPRRNAKTLTPTQRARLVDAIQQLNDPTKFYYDDGTHPPVSFWFSQDQIHQATHVHCGPAFLPWHRELVNRFENLLRLVHPEIKLPYWDWWKSPLDDQNFTPLMNPDADPSNDIGGWLGDANSGVDADGLAKGIGKPFGTVQVGTIKHFHNNEHCMDQDHASTISRGTAYGSAVTDCDGSCYGTALFSDPPSVVSRALTWVEDEDPNGLKNGIQSDGNIVSYGGRGDDAYQYFSNNLERGGSVGTSPNIIRWGNHNAAHGVIGGTISDQHRSFEDPFVFLLHANTDRLFAKWQRDYGNRGSDMHWLRRLIPDSTSDGTCVYGDQRNTTHNDDFSSLNCFDCTQIQGIADPLEPWAGSGSHVIYPWKDGNVKIVQKDSKHSTVVFPPLYSRTIDDGTTDVSALLKIPKLKDGESCIMAVPWYPPDPSLASCTGQEGHYCLLARIERNQDAGFGMTKTEDDDLPDNVVKNNNVAWKNIQLMPGPKNLLPAPVPPLPPCVTCPCIGVGEVLVGNANPTSPTNTKFVFGPTTDMQNAPATNLDKIVVDLGDAVHAKWVDGGKVGDGIIDDPCGPNVIDVSPTGGWIGNITFGADETDEIHLWSVPSATAPFFPYQFHLDQFTTVPGLPDKFVGGETFRGGCDSALPPTLPQDVEGGPAYKPTTSRPTGSGQPQMTDLVCSVHPNPASNSLQICIEDLAEGIPVVVEVLNSLGEAVATLYNGTTEAEMGFCFRFSCTDLVNGTYYAHVIAGDLRRSVKLTVHH